MRGQVSKGEVAGILAHDPPHRILATGSNTAEFDFSGNKNAQMAASGPYTVTDLELTCGSVTFDSPLAIAAPAFSAAQFQNVQPGLTVLSDTPVQTLHIGSFVDSTVTVAALGVAQGEAGLTVSGLPSGVSSAFTLSSVPIPGMSPLELTAASNAPLGTYTVTLSATSINGNASTTFTLTVVAADFALSIPSGSIIVAPSSQVNATITITPSNTFVGTVSLTTAGLPTGAVASFLPATVSGGSPSSSTMNIVTNGVAAGSYPFTINGTSGALTHSVPATLIASAAALPYPWVTQGIGANSAGGTATQNNGEFSVTGPGNSLSGTSDSYQFTYQPLIGDSTLIGRIAQTQNATAIAMAGIMIRETLDPVFERVPRVERRNDGPRCNPGRALETYIQRARSAR